MGYLNIPSGNSLVLKFFNPLFNDISSYSLPMSFNGKLADIKRAFGFPEKEEAEVKKNIEGRIKTKFLDLIGSWKITDSSNNTINAYFTPGSGDFYSQIKGVFLQDVDYGGVKWPTGYNQDWESLVTYLNTKMDVSYPESDYVVYCAYMPNAVNVGLATTPGFVNEVWFTPGEVLQLVNVGSNTGVYLFAGAVIDYLFTSLGYKIEENIFRKDADLQRLTIFNTFNLYPFANGDYYNQGRINYKDLVPHISCSDFIKAIRNRFNIGFFINEQEKSVRIRSFDSIVTDGLRFSVCATRPKLPVIENNRMSGILFPLNEPDAWSGHSYKSTDELKNPIIVSKYRDILPLTRTAGDLMFVQSESTYYRIVANEEDPPVNEAQRVSTDMFPYSEGADPEEVTQLSGIPAMYTQTINRAYNFMWNGNQYTAHTDVDYVIPRCDLVGNGYGQPFTDFPLMFLFARGIVNCHTEQPVENPNDNIQEYANLAAFPPVGVTHIRYLAIDTGYFYRWSGMYVQLVMPEQGIPPVYTYPIGTSDVYDASGSKIASADLALKWGGVYGLIKRFWTNRINWELNIKKLMKTDMLSEDIAKLINTDEQKRVGNSNYLVNSFEIEETGNKVVLRNVELLRL